MRTTQVLCGISLVLATLAADAPPPSPSPAVSDAGAIVSATIAPEPVHAGTMVVADVTTAPDVTSVDARVRSFKFSLSEVKPGEFRKSGKVPWIARFFKGTYVVTFFAHRADGTTAQTTQNVVLQ